MLGNIDPLCKRGTFEPVSFLLGSMCWLSDKKLPWKAQTYHPLGTITCMIFWLGELILIQIR